MSNSFRQQRVIALMILLALLLTVFLPQTFAQQDNICRDADAPIINYGETLTASINPSFPNSFFCFDAERGTSVTITVSPVTQNLSTTMIVGTPFVNSDGSLADEILVAEESPANGGAYQGTATITSDGTYLIVIQGAQNVQGTFRITIELSGGNVLGAAPAATPSDTTSSNSTGNNSSSNSGAGISNIIYGETNLCSTIYSSNIVFGETIVDSASGAQPLFYCFNASEGNIIHVDYNSIGDVPMAYLVVDPLFDATANAFVYSQGLSSSDGEVVSDEVIIQQDGQYVIVVLATTQDTGEFSLTVTSEEGNVYNCQNEPLNTLSTRQWGVVDADGTPLIEINVSCSERLSLATFGGAVISPYNVTQEDEFFFVYQNNIFVTVSLSEDEWVIQRVQDEQEFTLEALTDGEDCSTGDLGTLIEGSWYWQIDLNQQIFLDFTCNGIVIIDDQQNDAFAAPYDFTDNQLTLAVGDQPLVFENVELSAEVMSAQISGFDFEIQNVLYKAPEDVSAEATESTDGD